MNNKVYSPFEPIFRSASEQTFTNAKHDGHLDISCVNIDPDTQIHSCCFVLDAKQLYTQFNKLATCIYGCFEKLE